MANLPRLRQAVIAARDLDGTVSRLRDTLGLGEPFADPGVAMFGLRNAVFAIGDTFLEIVSPTTEEASAARLIERRGGDCGYMVMLQVEELSPARERARAQSVREVFEVELDDIAEVHLHPGDMAGAIVSLSTPAPAESWRWGGPGWEQRSVPGRVRSVTIEHPDPDALRARWTAIAGEVGGVGFARGADRGPVEIEIERDVVPATVEIGSVRVTATQST